jgi:hypothetical protein
MEKLQLLKKAITNNTLDNLPEEAFTNEELLILIEAKRQAKKLTVQPTLKSIASELLKSRPVTEHEEIKLTIQSISKAQDLDKAQYQLTLFRAKTAAKFNIVKKITMLYQTNKAHEAQDLESRLYELNQNQEDQLQEPINAMQWELFERAEMEEIRIQIDWFNDNNVPFKKKVLYSFIATTNGGKTIIKTWLGVMMIRSKHNVLYLAQEEPRLDTFRRVQQAILGLTEDEYAEQTKVSFEEVGKRFNQVCQEKDYGLFSAVEWPNVKISQLKRKIETSEIKYDVVIIDYGKLVETDSAKRNAQEWERIGIIFKELKAMAMELNICVVTSIQLNRESSMALNREGTVPDLTSVAGAFEATHHANYIWSVKLDYTNVEVTKTANTQLGTFTLYVQKQKYGNLRKGDSMAFTWTADHMLVQNPNYNAAPEITLGI